MNGTGDGGPGQPVSELSYTAASRELDEIVAFFEQREVDVDQLVARLERATAIVDELDRRLRRTRAQVEELVPRLQAASTPRSRVDERRAPAPGAGGAHEADDDDEEEEEETAMEAELERADRVPDDLGRAAESAGSAAQEPDRPGLF
ncbi:MAG: exodeoxyribonuclease VII small subunit [Acidimicrobiales bacterium]